MNIVETIERRQSIRLYSAEKLSHTTLTAIVEAGQKAPPISEASLEIRLVVNGAMIEEGLGGILGAYGKVIKAPHFAVVAGYEAPHYLLDAGYRFEHLILEATRLGIGTCWIGGMFAEPRLRHHLELPAKTKIIAITPLGFQASGSIKSGLGKVIRSAFGSTKRKPISELFFWETEGTPLPATITDNAFLMRWLESIRRAPSWANKQPWRFILRTNRILMYKKDRQLKEGKDYHLVDCGIAMAHLDLAGRALGFPGHWDVTTSEYAFKPPKAEVVGCYIMEQQLLV